MRAVLVEPDGSERRFDAPDEKLLGAWLKSWFETLSLRATWSPLEFQLKVYP